MEFCIILHFLLSTETLSGILNVDTIDAGKSDKQEKENLIRELDRMEACLLDIQRGSVHDGPGVRTTVFVKGCPLHCMWCYYPESRHFRPQLSYQSKRCSLCSACEKVCPQNVHTFAQEQHQVDFSKCIACGKCADVCPGEALRLFGQSMTTGEVLSIVLKDRTLYDQSGGGVTVSGGEPLSKADFVAELFARCREQEIHTCLETSGYGSPQSLRTVMPVTDLFLFDWKLHDRKAAMRYLGVSMSPILRSLHKLMDRHCKVLLRCPIIPRVNDTPAHFDSILQLLEKYPELLGAELLPYHNSGVDKSLQIGMCQPTFARPSEEQCAQWESYFHTRGFYQVKLAK